MRAILNGGFYKVSLRATPREDGTWFNYEPVSKEEGIARMRASLYGYSYPCDHRKKIYNGHVWRCKVCSQTV